MADTLADHLEGMALTGLSASASEWTPSFGAPAAPETGSFNDGDQSFDSLQAMLQQMASGSVPSALQESAQDEANLVEIEAAMAQDEINGFLDEQGVDDPDERAQLAFELMQSQYPHLLQAAGPAKPVAHGRSAKGGRKPMGFGLAPLTEEGFREEDEEGGEDEDGEDEGMDARGGAMDSGLDFYAKTTPATSYIEPVNGMAAAAGMGAGAARAAPFNPYASSQGGLSAQSKPFSFPAAAAPSPAPAAPSGGYAPANRYSGGNAWAPQPPSSSGAYAGAAGSYGPAAAAAPAPQQQRYGYPAPAAASAGGYYGANANAQQQQQPYPQQAGAYYGPSAGAQQQQPQPRPYYGAVAGAPRPAAPAPVPAPASTGGFSFLPAGASLGGGKR